MTPHKRNLLTQINEIVRNSSRKEKDGWYLQLSDIEDYEISALFRLIWESYDRDWDAVSHDAMRENLQCAIIKMLKDHVDAPIDIADLIRANLIYFYHEELQEMIDDSCLELFVEARDYPNE